jgi:hypothetical protein
LIIPAPIDAVIWGQNEGSEAKPGSRRQHRSPPRNKGLGHEIGHAENEREGVLGRLTSMSGDVGNVRVIKASGSVNDRCLQSRETLPGRLDTAKSRQIKVGKESIAERADDNDLRAEWAVAGEKRRQPRSKRAGSTGATHGETGPLAKSKPHDLASSTRDLDQIWMSDGVVIGDHGHRNQVFRGDRGEVCLLVICKGAPTDQQIAYCI